MDLETLRDTCRLSLGLEELTWDSTLSYDELRGSMERLYKVGHPLRDEISGIPLHLSHSSGRGIQLLQNGKISIPTDWV